MSTTGGAQAAAFLFLRGPGLSGSRSTGTLVEQRRNLPISSSSWWHSPYPDDPELLPVRTPVTGDGGGARNSGTGSSRGL